MERNDIRNEYQEKSSEKIKKPEKEEELKKNNENEKKIERIEKIKTNVDIPVKPSPGMENISNTCFINSTLQALLSIPKFRNLLNNHKCSNGNCITCALKETLNTREKTEKSCFEPTAKLNKRLFIAPYMIFGEQHDAHEFFSNLWEKMDSSNNEESVTKLFEGSLRKKVICTNCNHVQKDDVEIFKDLMIKIENIKTIAEGIENYFNNKTYMKHLECDKCNKNTMYEEYKIEKHKNTGSIILMINM